MLKFLSQLHMKTAVLSNPNQTLERLADPHILILTILILREQEKLIRPAVNHVKPDSSRQHQEKIIVILVLKGGYPILEHRDVYLALRY